MSEPAASERIPGREDLPTRTRRNTRYGIILSAVVAGMFLFAYANAEFFVMLCERAGILTARQTQVSDSGIDGTLGRDLDVHFTAMVNDGLPLSFSMVHRTQKTRVNGWQINDYRFTNLSNQTIYFKPVHDVFPTKAGLAQTLELRKCFCFDLQKIGPGESYTLPIEYRFNDSLPNGVSVIKMSYTLFPSTQKDYEAAQAAAEKEG